MTNDEWMESRLAYLRGLKAPSDQQRLLMLLAEKPDKSANDERKIRALVRAEKAAERAQKAKAAARRVVNEEKARQRKARNHELYKCAGLMIMAGLVDTRTGKPTRDRAELLGALASLAGAQISDDKRADWQRKGQALMSEQAGDGAGTRTPAAS